MAYTSDENQAREIFEAEIADNIKKRLGRGGCIIYWVRRLKGKK